MGQIKAFSIDSDFDPAENVKVLKSILVMFYRLRIFLLSNIFWADKLAGLTYTRMNKNYASKNLNVVLESAVLFIR